MSYIILFAFGFYCGNKIQKMFQVYRDVRNAKFIKKAVDTAFLDKFSKEKQEYQDFIKEVQS